MVDGARQQRPLGGIADGLPLLTVLGSAGEGVFDEQLEHQALRKNSRLKGCDSACGVFVHAAPSRALGRESTVAICSTCELLPGSPEIRSCTRTDCPMVAREAQELAA